MQNVIAKDGGSILHFPYRSLLSILFMALPHSLSTEEMAEYVIHHFECDRHGVAFSSVASSEGLSGLVPELQTRRGRGSCLVL